MKLISKWPMLFAFAMVLAGAQLITTTNAHAQSSYFTSRGCVNCHSAPVVASCAACHYHSGTLTATPNKTTSYAPGETVTVTMTASGARTGWIGARLYNQTGAEIARSTGNQSGMGGSTLYPAVLSAPAPATAGTYTWRMAYLGNNNGTGTGDVHSEKSVNVSITVAAPAPPADTTAPTVSAFTLPATSTSLTVPVSSLTASDNVAVTGYLVNTSAAAPAAAAAGWSAAAPTSVTAPNEGSVTFYAWAKDAAGNVSAAKSATVVITLPDTAAPVVGAFTLPATSTSLTVPVSSLTASDNVGVTGYLVNTSAAAPAAAAAGWTAAAPTSVTAPAAGSVTFYAWAKDAAGNVSAAKSATVVITLPDTAAPVVGAFTLPATATSLTVPVSSLTASDNVGVTGYLVNTSAAAPAAAAAGWTAAAPTSVTAPAAGSVTFYAWAKDAAGNVSAAKSATVVITLPDTAAPVVGAFTLPATSTSLTVPVSSLTASDNVAVTGYLVNTSSAAPAAAAAGWSAAAPTSVTAPNEGSVTFYAWAKDAAGNVSASRSATVTITLPPALDTINPALSVSTLNDGAVTSNPTLNVSGNATDNVALQSVTVNGSNVQLDASGNFSTAVVLVEGANNVTVVATDTAGNSSTVSRTITYVVSVQDLLVTAPVDNLVSAQEILVVQGTASENSTVTVTVNNGSPQVASLSNNVFTVSIYLQPGLNTIAIESVDPAGTISSAKRTVIYDNSNPTVAITEPGEDKIVSDRTLMIKGKVADALSKVTVKLTMGDKVYTPVVVEGKFEQKVSFTTPKQYTVVATATDEAGNQVSVSRNIIYKKGGSRRDND